MKARNIFVSYASGSFISARDQLCQSARAVGFDEVRARGFENLDPDFAATHQAILSQPRGGGYWLWKPQIILQELRTMRTGELLVYSDAGRSPYYRLRRFPQRLASKARQSGFLLGPTIGQHGPMAHWTKRDAFVLMQMDRPEVHAAAPIQATWSFWTPTLEAFDFLETWLACCTDPRILTDLDNTQGLPNLDRYRGHRHDQAVLSLLAYQHRANYLDQTGTLVERLLRLRPQSRLAHLFLKRIDDAEAVEAGALLQGMLRSVRDIWGSGVDVEV